LEIKLLQNEVNETKRRYGDNKTITWSGYNNLGYAANSYVDPKSSTFNIPILIDYDNGDTDVAGTPITSGGSKSYSFTPASGITGVSIQNGRISRNVANTNPSELPLGEATLTITVDTIPNVSPTSVSKTVNVKQDGVPVYPVYAGFVSDNIQTLNDSTPGISHYSTGYHEITCNGGNNVYFAILEKTINNPS